LSQQKMAVPLPEPSQKQLLHLISCKTYLE